MKHRGLRRLIERGEVSGLPAAHAAKIEAIVAFLAAAPSIEAVRRLRTWKAHQLAGDRKGTWSLSVSRNWRVTFRLGAEAEIIDLDFEDYH
ncbi:MAG: type II toxin-antitoxin system RelE/ParE family toxin [Alphaproteobacteria bacterium]